MKSAALTVKDYLAGLPADRRAAIEAVRDVVNRRLPKGYREEIAYGLIAWCVPLEVCPDTYNGQPLMYAALGSQKQYMAVYLPGVHGDSPNARAFRDAFAKAGKKLDMGKSCVRFRRLEDLHLPAIGRAIAAHPMTAFVARMTAAHPPRSSRAKPAKPAKPAARKRRGAV